MEAAMSRRQLTPLRPLSADERRFLERISRAFGEPSSHVTRAKILLAVADGASFTAAAQGAGRRSGDAVGQLVARFNEDGIAAVVPRHGGGHPRLYGNADRQRILDTARRPPDRATDGTGTWSPMTLRESLRREPDGLPNVSTFTIQQVLAEAGWSWQRSRTWCETGQVLRRRKHGPVAVSDPDGEVKKT